MKYCALILMLLCPLAWADSSFIMKETHCSILKQTAFQAIAAKTSGGTYPAFVRERVRYYEELQGTDKQRYLEILPYLLQMAYEYFTHPFDEDTPYESVIYDRCLTFVGTDGQ